MVEKLRRSDDEISWTGRIIESAGVLKAKQNNQAAVEKNSNFLYKTKKKNVLGVELLTWQRT